MLDKAYLLIKDHVEEPASYLRRFYGVQIATDALEKLRTNPPLDPTPFVESWKKMLREYLRCAVWCAIYDSARLAKNEKDATKLADEAARKFEKDTILEILNV